MSEKKETFKRLTEHKQRAKKLPFNMNEDKIVIFSDVHKWDRGRKSDFFLTNEFLYCSVLEHYSAKDFKIILNGDVENLMESPANKIVDTYKNTYTFEKKFVERNDYYRTYGNHDHDWKKDDLREKYLKPLLGDFPIHPAFMLGEQIIVLHGHEGDLFADEIRGFTKIILRNFKKFFIKLFRKNPRAAKNHKIRGKREKYLFQWAAENHLLLIAGHTHRPSFGSISVTKKLEQQKQKIEMSIRETMTADDIRHSSKKIAEINRDLKLFSEEFPKDKEIQEPGEPEQPNYFNSGGCVFRESITAIEINQGKISLLKWFESNGQIQKDWQYLTVNLEDVLNKI